MKNNARALLPGEGSAFISSYCNILFKILMTWQFSPALSLLAILALHCRVSVCMFISRGDGTALKQAAAWKGDDISPLSRDIS